MPKVAQVKIPGWFDFQDIYSQAVAEGKDGDVFVEIGVFCGASACFMGELIRDSGKKITFFGVDPFQDFLGFEAGSWQQNMIFEMGGSLPVAKHFLLLTGTTSYVHLLPFPSLDAAKLFKPGSVARVFIDGGHDYRSAHDDISTWFPLVRDGGWIGGHDYAQGFPGVIQAVDELFPQVPRGSLFVPPSSWMYHKP
jgi:hypothetical protein